MRGASHGRPVRHREAPEDWRRSVVEDAFFEGVGGPGPEDLVNAGALLASALAREARHLAEAEAWLLHKALPNAPPAVPPHLGRSTRFASFWPGTASAEVDKARRGDAAETVRLRAWRRGLLALAASNALAESNDPKAIAEHLTLVAGRLELPPAAAAPALRAAALSLPTDDAAARIAATELVVRIVALLPAV